jgi:hypothetical protein
VFSSTVAGSNSSWVRLAVERSAPLRIAPTRIACARSTPERSAPARFASVRSASDSSAPLRFAPLRSALMRSALKRIALSRFALSRFALIRSASDSSVLARVASERSALGRSALRRSAPVRFGSLERSHPLQEFQVAVAPLMASWSPLFWDTRLPQHIAYHNILRTTSVGEAKPSVRSPRCPRAGLQEHSISRSYAERCTNVEGRENFLRPVVHKQPKIPTRIMAPPRVGPPDRGDRVDEPSP